MDSTGLEFDRTRMLLRQNRPEYQYLEATPAELPRATTSAPEVVPGPEKEVIFGRAVYEPSNHDSTSRTPSLWRRWKLWLLLTVVVIAIVIAVAVAVVVHLGIRHGGSSSQNGSGSSSSEPSSNAPAPPTSSAAGALNGTALTTFNVDANKIPVTHIFYQDYKAQIRRLQKINSTWSGGSNLPAVVDFNAKPGTPLACVNYTDPGTNITTAHLFYVNPSNVLQEVISTDNLSTWDAGPLSDSNFTASTSAIALAAIYSESWFGKDMGNSSGLRLYYGATDNQVHELAFALGSTYWSLQSTFNATNGNAGISASPPGGDTGEALLFMMDTQNQIRVWSLNSTVNPDPAVPTYGNWTQASIRSPVVAFENSSLGYAQGWLSFQEQSRVISAVQTYPSGLSGSPWGPIKYVGAPDVEYAQSASSVLAASVWLGDNEQFPWYLDIFYQPNGSAIMECFDTDGQYILTQLPVGSS